MEKVKTAVVGCGVISNVYIRNLKNLFHIIDLRAVANRSPEAAREKAALYGIDRVMTVDEVAASPDIELVVNLTPTGAHYGVIRQMLEAGKHVYTEKMLTATLEQADEVVALADGRSLYLGVAPDTVLGAGIQTARKLIDTGMIGRVTSAVACINRDQCLNSEHFRFLRGDGGALPYDVGPYYIAALLALLGPVKSVCGFGVPAPVHEAQLLMGTDEMERWQIPGNNLTAGVLQFASGALGSIHFDGNTIGETKHVLTIYGTEGILELGDPNCFDGEVRLTRAEGGSCVVPHTHGYNGKPTLPDATQWEHIYGHRGIGVAEMAWAIRTGRPNRCSKELGYHVMEVLIGMDRAAASGSTYQLHSTFEMKPLRSGYYSTMGGGSMRADAERSLIE